MKYYAKLISYAVITLLIGSMGIYFFTSYMEEQRIEVSIDKTLIKEDELKDQ